MTRCSSCLEPCSALFSHANGPMCAMCVPELVPPGGVSFVLALPPPPAKPLTGNEYIFRAGGYTPAPDVHHITKHLDDPDRVTVTEVWRKCSRPGCGKTALQDDGCEKYSGWYCSLDCASPDQSADESGLPRTPHGRIRQLEYLRDEGVIDQEQFRRLMDAPDIADELGGSNAHTDLCECPSCRPSVCSECRASAPVMFEDSGRRFCLSCHGKLAEKVKADSPWRKEFEAVFEDARKQYEGFVLGTAAEMMRAADEVKAESGSNFPPSASTTRSATGDVVEFHFRLGELHGAVAFDGRLMRHLGDKGQMGLDVMATEVRGMLKRYFAEQPALTAERLARAEWRVDPEVSEYIDEASEYEDRIAAGALSAEADAHREQIAAIAWERREPAGSRERAEQRAEAVLDRLRGTK